MPAIRVRHLFVWAASLIVLAGVGPRIALAQPPDDAALQHFERRVRPLLIEHCHKCHAGESSKGGLQLDSRAALLRGGDSGPAILVGRPDASLLIQAVRHQNGLEMPPDGKLSETLVAELARWIAAGAAWPEESDAATALPSSAGDAASQALAPNEGELADALQLWLRADALALDDGEPVYVWPDQSGHGRDVAATKGIRTDGVGQPGRFIRTSALMNRPAVRFNPATGFASSPDHPVAIRGDAALTMLAVVHLERHEAQPPYDGILGIGNPAHGGDPGRPLAALLQINRGEDHALHFAGGWNHDASLGAGSFTSHYGRPLILTITKVPGPMRRSTQFFINGEARGLAAGEVQEGSETIPDIQHRDDIGAYLGKAVSWAGSIQGDVGEVLIYNRALHDEERIAVERHLADKFGLVLRPAHELAPEATFSAEETNFWAFQPVRDVAPPAVRDETWIQSPVDRFILAELERQGLAPAVPAAKTTWLRRVSFDLTGLPPTPQQVRDFLADDSPAAYARVVDRLLESPHYGERWARHWLDVVRYAETTANDANAVMQYAWRYRNYVIDSFNQNLPYDQFLIEQLAGDLLPSSGSIDTDTKRIIATGYLMIGPKALAETDKEQSRLDIVDDQIDVTGRAMLGLTLACARCHDHKFDAVRTADYYALAGIFRSTEPFQNENRNATMWWELPVPQGEGAEPLMVMAPKEALPRNLRIHIRGNRFTLGPVAQRGFLQVLATVHPPGSGNDRAATAKVDLYHPRSGRLELARWIASPHNPLTARVMVNRIWQHHFGRGIVATSDNFGTRGQPPSHPELLDWLAAHFVASGWSVKAMHRTIVLSSTYRQSGEASEKARAADPERQWLAWFARRRLSAEELRDAMLAVSGQLDPAPGTTESADFLFSKAEDINAQIRPNRAAADDPFYTDFTKRSIYLPIVRNMLPDTLALFDAADPNGVTAVRNETTVPAQALFLLNSPFVRRQARALAERLLNDTELTDEQRLDRAHRAVLCRSPSEEEAAELQPFLTAYSAHAVAQSKPESERRLAAWQSYCQLLLCSNEFLTLE